MPVSVGLISSALMTKQLPEAPERPPRGQLEPNLHLGQAAALVQPRAAEPQPS